MEVRKTHHIEKEEADATGSYDSHYEYDQYCFSDAGLTLVARSYADQPTDAHFLRSERDGKSGILGTAELAGPLFREAVRYLRKEGKTSLRYLSAAGYEAIESNT